MNRRTFLSAVTGGLLAAPPATEAQQQGKVYRLGTLNLGVPPAPEIYDARRDVVVVLRDLSYVEGRNLEVERRYADGRVDRLPALAAELVQRHVDVIVASGSDAVRAARAATKAIPIVILIAGQDPVELGLTPSPVDPGEHHRCRARKRTRGQAIGTHQGNGPPSDSDRDACYGRRRDPSPGEGSGAGRGAPRCQARRGRYGLRRQVSDLSAKVRLPAMYPSRDYPEEGGVMSYGINRRQIYRRAAEYVDRILKGAKPADLPVEQPTKFELIINLKTAKALGLTIPPSLLQRADQVIE